MQRHIYRDDGTQDADGLGRCVHCGTPEKNQRHNLPDVPEQAEHRRRAGERQEG